MPGRDTDLSIVWAPQNLWSPRRGAFPFLVEQGGNIVVSSEGIELLVLARYMQVLSDDLCRRLSGKAINIHHSFLASFKGARSYKQTHDRGVKLIAALSAVTSKA